MIEVNLISIAAGDNFSRAGRCIARNRFDREAMGVSVEEFVKGFLKENVSKFETGLGSRELVELINSSEVLSRKDLSCINYYLVKVGYKVVVFNVTDDEENATGVPDGDVVEWNIIDRNFIQDGYPTATKIVPGSNLDIPKILRQIVTESNLFPSTKFSGVKNPFTELLNNLDYIKNTTGDVNSSITSKIYEILDTVGFDVLCITSEY